MIAVVSTGFNAPTKTRCLASVARQHNPDRHEVAHFYIEASEQRPVRGALENFAGHVADMPPEWIVVWLDGDDWLLQGALRYVERMYEDLETWMTWGQFVTDTDWYGSSRPFKTDNYRQDLSGHPSHLKTFRAGLFQHIEARNLEYKNVWDYGTMLPMLEMSGPEHARFNPIPLMVYNFASSDEAKQTQEKIDSDAEILRGIRAEAPYDRLRRAPW